MKDTVNYIVTIAIFAFLWMGCASSGPLGGGPVDKTPPNIVLESSTPNMSTNFIKKDIVLTFDEYVEVKDLIKELAVSPPLTYRLQAKSRGKKVVLSFNTAEVLKDSVTYIINLGNALRDFRAGNILENYRFVFSTGDFIDSLSISGTVNDLETGQPVDNAIVMVYDDLRDSAVIQSKPFYFTKTDENGKFSIENIKSDTFRVYACSDQNANYVYNVGEESIGFLTKDIILDTASISDLSFELSTPAPSLRMVKYTNDYQNTVDLIYNIPLSIKPEFSFDQEVNNWSNIKIDTFRIWYETELDSITLILPNMDTITLFKKDKKPSSKLKMSTPKNASNYKKGDTLVYYFNAPIIKIIPNDSSWLEQTNIKETKQDSTITRDTITEITKLEFFILPSGYDVGVVPKVEPNELYKVRIHPNTFTDLYGRSNDSLIHNISVVNEEELSEVILKIFNFDTTCQNVVKVFTNSKTYYESSIIGLDTLNLKFSRFIPEVIKIEVISDINNNSRWDAANIWGRIPPEKIFKQQISAPKPNWTIEEEIDLSKKSIITAKEKSQSDKPGIGKKEKR